MILFSAGYDNEQGWAISDAGRWQWNGGSVAVTWSHPTLHIPTMWQ